MSAATAPGVIELKAEKQRADQQAGLKPKPTSTLRTMDEDDAVSGLQSWLQQNKPIVALAAVAFVAVVVQSLGLADVKQAVLTLLSPITTATWKVLQAPSVTPVCACARFCMPLHTSEHQTSFAFCMGSVISVIVYDFASPACALCCSIQQETSVL